MLEPLVDAVGVATLPVAGHCGRATGFCEHVCLLVSSPIAGLGYLLVLQDTVVPRDVGGLHALHRIHHHQVDTMSAIAREPGPGAFVYRQVPMPSMWCRAGRCGSRRAT